MKSSGIRWTVAIVTLLALAGGSAMARRVYLDAALLRAPPDAIPGRRDLIRYAQGVAEPVYRSHCASCHGADLRGDPVRGAPNLADSDWLYGGGSISQIQQTITYGIRSGNPKGRSLASMPAFAHPGSEGREKVNPLTPGEIDDLVEFLFSVENRPADSAAAARGALLYSDKGVCYDCHSRDAQGDQAIGAPNLGDSVWLYGDGSRRAVFNSIAQGRAGACPAWGQRFGPALLRAVAVFIYAKSHPLPAT
ncbi:MAG: c-type cytochrome [Caulobacteraceae bacterium]|nr:c-type cytochrome [Caulobacteraceae bacterium]